MADTSLRVLTPGDCQSVLEWRNAAAARPGLRTPYPLTAEMQDDFYTTVVSNRRSPHRYWGIHRDDALAGCTLVGMGGLTNIQWENGIAEISLLTSPSAAGQGHGQRALGLLLEEAFDRMRLLTVFGECYESNPALGFWEKMVQVYRGDAARLPRRKWWAGRLWDAYYFTFTVERWREPT